MRQAAQQMGLSPSGSGQNGEDGPSQQPGNLAGEFGGQGLNSLAELEGLLGEVSGRDWGQLPGTLQSELLESARQRTDGEYSRLIRRYFQNITRARSPELNDDEPETEMPTD